MIHSWSIGKTTGADKFPADPGQRPFNSIRLRYMLIEDAIVALQIHEVPGKAAEMRTYHKVERAYWGLGLTLS